MDYENKKKPTLKNCLIFQEMELSKLKLKMLLIFQVGTCKFWKWKISHTFPNKEAKFSKIQYFLEVIKKHFSSLYNVFFLYSTRVFFRDIFVTSIFYIFIKILISLTSFFFWQSFFILLIFSFLCIWKNFYKKKKI